MPIVNRVADLHDEIKAWRQDIHAHPELMFDVHRTAGVVAEKLKSFGCDEVVTGIGSTGVVGVIRGKKGSGTRTIGLRADMDALPIEEATGLPTSRRTPARCTPAAMTGTPRCFWARPSTSPRPATSTAPRW